MPDERTDCWFDEPLPGDRRSWAVPPGHGVYQGLELERLDPDDEDERTFLLEAQHLDMEEALKRHEEMTGADGEPMNPRLHITLHQVIANQLLADDPPETWQTVQRLAGLGYDWHNVMHLVMGPVTEAVYETLAEKRPFDRADYVRRLAELPGDWPPPEELGLRRRGGGLACPAASGRARSSSTSPQTARMAVRTPTAMVTNPAMGNSTLTGLQFAVLGQPVQSPLPSRCLACSRAGQSAELEVTAQRRCRLIEMEKQGRRRS